MKERKKFKVNIDNKEQELMFKNPNQEELLAIDLEYRKIFSQCLREGVMSEAEARKLAEKTGVFTKEDDKKISQVAVEINILESIVKNEDGKYDDDKIQEAVTKLSGHRADFISLINQKVEVISKSAEGLANQQRVHKFVRYCCINDKEERLFDNDDAYENFAQNYPDAMSEIFKQAYFFEYGDPDKITEEWAEIKYLKKKVKENDAQIKAEAEPKEEKRGRKKKEIAAK